MLSVLWDIKGPININFPEKHATANCVSSCQIFRQNSPYLLNDRHIKVYSWFYAIKVVLIYRNKLNFKIIKKAMLKPITIDFLEKVQM